MDDRTKYDKMQGELRKSCENQAPAPPAVAGCDTQQGIGGYSPTMYKPSIAEEKAKSAAYHQEEANKATRAACFLALHPEFQEFIELVRSRAFEL